MRQLQDRIQQANVAGYEIENVDKQVLTQQIRISIAQQEVNNQQKQGMPGVPLKITTPA